MSCLLLVDHIKSVCSDSLKKFKDIEYICKVVSASWDLQPDPFLARVIVNIVLWNAESKVVLASVPTQWLTVVSLPLWRTLYSCLSQEPHTVVWPGLAVMKVLCGGEETTALCVERTDCGAGPS